MKDEEIGQVRAALEDFVAEMFVSLPRKDHRAKGSLYLRGLMLDGRRKSLQPMAERLAVDHQQLQQFLASSIWAVEPVRRRLAGLAVETIGPEAWVIDDTGFKKDGPSSPCVARQYSGTLGKIGNCQIGVSVHAATDAASCPLDWRLFVPEAWDDTCADTNEEAAGIQTRRSKAGIPDTVRHRTKWSLALEMIDEATAWGLTPPVVVADAGLPWSSAASAMCSPSRPPPAPTPPMLSPSRRPTPAAGHAAWTGTGINPPVCGNSRSPRGAGSSTKQPGDTAAKPAQGTGPRP